MKVWWLVGAFGLFVALSCEAAPIDGKAVRVIDGDTVEVGGKVVRLIGLNAPETRSAQCDAERQLGQRAKDELASVVASSSLDLEFVPCSCRPGTEGTDKCNRGRSCGILRAEGVNVALLLIRNGLAVPFTCGATSCPKLPRPWCG